MYEPGGLSPRQAVSHDSAVFHSGGHLAADHRHLQHCGPDVRGQRQRHLGPGGVVGLLSPLLSDDGFRADVQRRRLHLFQPVFRPGRAQTDEPCLRQRLCAGLRVRDPAHRLSAGAGRPAAGTLRRHRYRLSAICWPPFFPSCWYCGSSAGCWPPHPNKTKTGPPRRGPVFLCLVTAGPSCATYRG